MTFEEAKNLPISAADLDNPKSDAYLALKAAEIAKDTVRDIAGKIWGMYVDARIEIGEYTTFGEWYEKKLQPIEDEIYGIDRAVAKAIEKWRNENDID